MSAISTYMLVFIPKRLSTALSSLSELVSVLAVLDSNLDRTLLDLSAINPQPSLNNVTRHNRSNTLRRARKHNIALLQRHLEMFIEESKEIYRLKGRNMK